MNRRVSMIFLTVILLLSTSCVEKTAAGKGDNRLELASNIVSDTLKFTSGTRAVFQDSQGNYWFGSHSEGVCRFDGKSFTYFTMNDGLSDNHVYSIQEDEKGNIWFDTQHGVSSFDGTTIKNHTMGRKPTLQTTPFVQNDDVAEGEWSKEESDLWFSAGTREGVLRFDGQRLHYLPFPDSKSRPNGNVYSVTGFSPGTDRMLWIATFAGVFGFNGDQMTIINDETLQSVETEGQIHVRSILEDTKGRLWIGNNGIGVLLKDGDTIINFSKQQGKLLPTIDFQANTNDRQFHNNSGLQAVFDIAEDARGNIWFADRDSGVWMYDGNVLTSYIVDEELNSQMAWDIYEDRNKNLLFAMATGGVYRFNGKSFDKWF
ncbi:MAG: two-component regulator propeller domain-containing protein [Bacteroidota bacterium]